MCYEPRNEEFAKVCRERDELKRDLEETKELLEAAKNAQGMLQIHLVKVQDERDELKAAYDGAKLAMKALNEKLVKVTAERNALEKIVAGGIDACGYCGHEIEGMCGNTYECVECMERCVCGTCNGGSAFEYRGVEADHG